MPMSQVERERIERSLGPERMRTARDLAKRADERFMQVLQDVLMLTESPTQGIVLLNLLEPEIVATLRETQVAICEHYGSNEHATRRMLVDRLIKSLTEYRRTLP